MKHLTLLIILFLMGMKIEAQSISKQVIGSSGMALTNNTTSINFTVGEVIIGEVENEITLHQGFWAKLVVNETLGNQILKNSTENVAIFPNPVINQLQVKYNIQNAENYNLTLYDVNGKQIFNIKPINHGKKALINVRHLSQGIYCLLYTSPSPRD